MRCKVRQVFKSLFNGTPEEKLIKFDLFRSLFFHAIPIIFTVLVTYFTLTANIFNSLLNKLIGCTCFCVIIINIYNAWNETIKKDFIEEIYKLRQIENQQVQLTRILNNMSNEIFSNITWSVLLTKVTSTIFDFIQSPDRNNNQEILNLIKDKIITIIFDYLTPTLDKGEYITLALYLLDENNNMLIDYTSKKSKVMPKEEHGRSWDINSESQIAHTYRSGQYHVFYDIQQFLPGLSQNEKREQDELFYRASITYPLCYYNTNNTVRGVFCITSNKPGAFSGSNNNPDIGRLFLLKQNIIFAICSLLEMLLNNVAPASNNDLLSERINETPQI